MVGVHDLVRGALFPGAVPGHGSLQHLMSDVDGIEIGGTEIHLEGDNIHFLRNEDHRTHEPVGAHVDDPSEMGHGEQFPDIVASGPDSYARQVREIFYENEPPVVE